MIFHRPLLRHFLAFLSVSVGLMSCREALDKDTRPNIIVVLIDDAGYVDFGFMGSNDLDTPNIDLLARSGVIFTDAHVSATVCAPSRAGLLTGKYQQRFGFEANGTGSPESGEIGLADDVITLATVLQRHDYNTIALGKWHLGTSKSDHPNQRGFDEFYGFLAGGRSYFPIKNPSEHQMLQQNGKRITFDGYLTDVLGDRALRYIEENKEHPFFMYLAFNAVHTPMHAKKEHLEKYKNHPRQKLAAMTWSLDENIGKIMATLEAQEDLENTLFFFLSDNGGATTNSSLNGPLKGFKGNKYEGGHRVPFVLSWKAVIKGGDYFDGLSSSLDIFPTALAAAGIDMNEGQDLNGVNLLPFVKGEMQGDPHNKLFWRKLEGAAVRIGNHKLIRLEGFGSVLYNLETDLGETTDLSTTDKEGHDDLIKALQYWETTLMDPLWNEGPYWKGHTSEIHQNLMRNTYSDVLGMKAYLEKNKEKE
ncbi:MAG: sulfatase-like hydrolase/transferase [Flavobacteriaceae bacterium]